MTSYIKVASLLHYIIKTATKIFADLQLDRSSCTQDACAAQSCAISLVLRLAIRNTAGQADLACCVSDHRNLE
jgi:hypothetical protein